MCTERHEDCYDLTHLDLGCDNVGCLQVLEGEDIRLMGRERELTQLLDEMKSLRTLKEWPNVSNGMTDYCIIPFNSTKFWMTGGSRANQTLRTGALL